MSLSIFTPMQARDRQLRRTKINLFIDGSVEHRKV